MSGDQNITNNNEEVSDSQDNMSKSTNLTTVSSPTQVYATPPQKHQNKSASIYRPAAFIVPGRKQRRPVPLANKHPRLSWRGY